MKRTLTYVFLLACFFGTAQKNDYVWLSGYESSDGYDSMGRGWGFGNTKMDFNQNPVDINYDSLGMYFGFTNTSFCDNDGHLLLYTNGIYVANAHDQIIPNSWGMNAGYIDQVWDPSIQTYGYRNTQGALALQSISNPNQYYIFHSFTDSLPGSNGTDLYCAKLLNTLIDLNANSGQGEAIYKNQMLISDSLGYHINAVRHGNGRDWWVLIHKRESNCFYRILLDATGPHLMPDLTCGGLYSSYQTIGTGCFSPDGSKYACLFDYGGLCVYDFDRCSGMLSSPQCLSLPVLRDSVWIGNGVAISPNGRYLYASITKYIYQFDLSNANIFSSIDTIGKYDGFHLPVGSFFDMAQLGPDGKIYISCGNTEADFHVINNPDEGGAACNFVQHGIRLPTLCNSVPNFPNYRLGALSGSACDTLTGLSEDLRAEKERILKVYPNPASSYTIVDYGYTDWNKGEVSLEIANELGQVVYEQMLPMYSGFQKLDVGSYATGVYMVYIKRADEIIATNKFVKE